MTCDRCHAETRVTDSRTYAFGVYRRRKCTSCGNRTSTYEIAIDGISMARKHEIPGLLERARQLLRGLET